MKVSGPSCYHNNFKKLSVLAQTIRCLYNSAHLKNAISTILIAVKNVKVFLIPWYTHPVLKKYILTKETNRAVFVKQVS